MDKHHRQLTSKAGHIKRDEIHIIGATLFQCTVDTEIHGLTMSSCLTRLERKDPGGSVVKDLRLNNFRKK